MPVPGRLLPPPPGGPAVTAPSDRGVLADRIARSAADPGDGTAGVLGWLADLAQRSFTTAERVPLEELAGWKTDPRTGDLVHDTGRFYTIHGLDVTAPDGPVPHWRQPIIDQPEVGVLGILAREFDGVLRFLLQAKAEPGNVNGLQLSPTVQATRSNYTGAHRGRAVPYLEYFQRRDRRTVIADVRQSEQGAWFRRKRNRNMVVEVREDVEVREGFRWLTLGQLHGLLAVDDVVNMDTRTVLACLPLTGAAMHEGDGPATGGTADDGFREALRRSARCADGAAHPTPELLSWLTDRRSTVELRTRRIGLAETDGWRRRDGRISHERGRFFDVVGVAVRARGREVDGWDQPMIAAVGTGIVAFLVRRVDGVLHALVHARAEPGFVDVVELAPTVQCQPDNHIDLPAAARPPYLDEVLRAAPERVRFAATLSEEGGRFFHTRNRYLVVEVGPAGVPEHPDYRWVTLRQLDGLLRHSHYLNVEARSLVACLHSLRHPNRGES
ncbi:NDP-hexose 2,3-dehydratase family protein [Micromonospora okii]|uniref:2,3-hexose dehydratase n=1 Tax=Micromonospora okii TaxID=1182970 RepID=A0A023GUI6_9ACTN|nr:NDP-hexose 2,3-dehydratase family protein [Micromonospora okii]AFJ52685.1 2,3-hexose dehydratase [Micromonospora okii]